MTDDNNPMENLRTALEQAENSLQAFANDLEEDMERREQAAIDSMREYRPFKLEVDLDRDR